MHTRRALMPFLCLAGPFVATAALAADPPALLQLRYDEIARENKAAPMSGACPVHVLPTVDARQNKETIGASIRGALATGDAAPWIADGLAHLKDYGFAVDAVESRDPRRDGITVTPTLTRAYTWQIGFKIFSMVALKVEFADRNGVLQDKYYRAHGDKTNMWGAELEYVTTLNYGLNNLLVAMGRDLVSLCKGAKVEPYTYAGPDPAAKK